MTRILFVDNDQVSFEFRKCVATVVSALSPLELFHAEDATEALNLVDQVKPDVIVLDGDMKEEGNLFLENLTKSHPPVLVQMESEQIEKSRPRKQSDKTQSEKSQIQYVVKDESLDGLHQTLIQATSLAQHRHQRSDLVN
jgi:chemotaxis response regulator CheB